MANELMQAGGTLLLPWTNFSLRTLETMVAWQQQMLEQWFRLFSAWTPPGAVPADPVDLLQIAGTAESATTPSARPQAARAASPRSRQSVSSSERPQAQSPRRAASSKPKRRSRRA